MSSVAVQLPNGDPAVAVRLEPLIHWHGIMISRRQAERWLMAEREWNEYKRHGLLFVVLPCIVAFLVNVCFWLYVVRTLFDGFY